jgi:hypothetical protein
MVNLRKPETQHITSADNCQGSRLGIDRAAREISQCSAAFRLSVQHAGHCHQPPHPLFKSVAWTLVRCSKVSPSERCTYHALMLATIRRLTQYDIASEPIASVESPAIVKIDSPSPTSLSHLNVWGQPTATSSEHCAKKRRHGELPTEEQQRAAGTELPRS